MRSLVGLILVSLVILITLNATAITELRFAKYRKIEAYEVRAGILMMPRYTTDDKVCELGLERLHYSPNLIRLDSGLARDEIFQALDELVPLNERGAPSKNIDNQIRESGQSLTTNIEYENVSIRIYGATLPSKHKNEIVVNELVATVKWKNRTCR